MKYLPMFLLLLGILNSCSSNNNQQYLDNKQAIIAVQSYVRTYQLLPRR